MLIAEVAGDRHFGADRAVRHASFRTPPDPTTGRSPGASRAGSSKSVEQLVVPVEGPQVHQLRPAGVGHVGDVKTAVGAAGQVPDHPGVDGAEDRGAVAAPHRARRRRCRGSSAASATRSRWPAAGPSARDSRARFGSSAATSRSVRVSCQTIALCHGRPVFGFQTIVVSRWLVMPIAARSRPVRPAVRSAPAITSSTRAAISIGSCSTQPGRGRICRCSS